MAALLVAASLIVGGAILRIPGLLVVGAALGLFAALSWVWSRYGLDSVSYDRLVKDRAVAGDELSLRLVVWNAKWLPLPLLRVEDLATEGLRLPQRGELQIDSPGRRLIENGWSLRSFQRITRQLRLVVPKRGVFELGPARLKLAPLFGGRVVVRELLATHRIVVRPRALPMRNSESRRSPLGEHRVAFSLYRDPTLFAGARPFQVGDSLRHIHWRASVRAGQTLTKRFEPAAARHTVIALDVQTIDGPYWMLDGDEDLFEGLCIVAASAARNLIADGVPCGLIAGTQARAREWLAYAPPRADQSQLGFIGDLLAKIEPPASRPFQRVLSALPQRVPAGVTILVLTARDPALFVPQLRRLRRLGFGVGHVGVGERAAEFAARARGVGIDSWAVLTDDWRQARVIDVA